MNMQDYQCCCYYWLEIQCFKMSETKKKPPVFSFTSSYVGLRQGHFDWFFTDVFLHGYN